MCASCEKILFIYYKLVKKKLMFADGGNVLLCLKMLIPVKKNCLDSK